jgi:hypothetical protein
MDEPRPPYACILCGNDVQTPERVDVKVSDDDRPIGIVAAHLACLVEVIPKEHKAWFGLSAGAQSGADRSARRVVQSPHEGPILRATDAAGDVYDDPSEDALFMFMEDLRSAGSSFLVQRLEPGREDEWVRVSRRENGLYELSSSHHVHYASSLRPVHDFLTRWAFDLFSPEEER